MTSEQKPKKPYRFTQAIYNYAPPKARSKPKIGLGLFLLIILIAALVLYILHESA
jgi:hypothetical protein